MERGAWSVERGGQGSAKPRDPGLCSVTPSAYSSSRRSRCSQIRFWYAKGVKQHSPGSRAWRAHPGAVALQRAFTKYNRVSSVVIRGCVNRCCLYRSCRNRHNSLRSRDLHRLYFVIQRCNASALSRLNFQVEPPHSGPELRNGRLQQPENLAWTEH